MGAALLIVPNFVLALGLPLAGFAGETLSLLGQAALAAGLLCVGAAMRIEKTDAPLAAHA